MPELAQIKSLSAGTIDYENYWQVKINGGGIDLAYVFVDSRIENNFANLAAIPKGMRSVIADCSVQKVSPRITFR